MSHAETLKRSERAYQTAAKKAEALRAVRNSAIRAALGDGLTHAEIARHTGLTRGRVGQLAK